MESAYARLIRISTSASNPASNNNTADGSGTLTTGGVVGGGVVSMGGTKKPSHKLACAPQFPVHDLAITWPLKSPCKNVKSALGAKILPLIPPLKVMLSASKKLYKILLAGMSSAAKDSRWP